MKIWVDDIREPPRTGDVVVWCKTSQETIVLLERAKMIGRIPEIMSLDHDLGGDDTTRPIVLWMCENDFWPVEVRVHSANPTGVEWLEPMISRYHPANIAKHQMVPPNLNGQYTCVECGESWPCRVVKLNKSDG